MAVKANTIEHNGERIHIALSPEDTLTRLGKFLLSNGITAAQWGNARAALIKRAKGESMTAQEDALADRGQALAAAVFFDMVTPTDMP